MVYSTSYALGGDGKYTVFFNGLVALCDTDLDCPTGTFAMCNNMTYLSQPGMCTCNYALAEVGDDCMQLSANGLAGGVISAVSAAIAGVALVATLVAIVRLVMVERGIRRNALFTTTCLALLGNASLLLYTGPFANEILIPAYTSTLQQPGGHRAPQNQEIVTVSIVFAFFFVTASALNVSLVWISVADAAQKMSTKTALNAGRYRNALILYYLVFFVGMIILLFSGNPVGATLLALPGILIVIFTYIAGWFKMYSVIKSIHTSEKGNVSENTLRLKRSLRQISMTSISLSLVMTLIIVTFLSWVITGGFNNNYPDRQPGFILVTVVWLFVTLAELTVSIYVCVVVYHKRFSSQQSDRSGTAASSHGPKDSSSIKLSKDSSIKRQGAVLVAANSSAE